MSLQLYEHSCSLRHQRMAKCLFVVLLLISGQVLAESPWGTLRKFGLTGTWATSCHDEPSLEHFWHTFFQDDQGKVHKRNDRGPGIPQLNSDIIDAQIIGPNRLKLIERLNDKWWESSNGCVYEIIIIKENGQTRTLQSKTSDGTILAKDGINTSSGERTPWLEKCHD